MSTPQEPNQSSGSQGQGSSIPPQTPEEPKSGSDIKEKLNTWMADTKKLLESTAKTLVPYVNKGVEAAGQGFKKGKDLVQEQIKAHTQKKTSSQETSISDTDTPKQTPSQTSSKMPEPPQTPTPTQSQPTQTMTSNPTSYTPGSETSETPNAPTSTSTPESENKSPNDKS